MAYRQTLGRRGEDLACALLEEQGYEIVARNWRCRRGEIDVVARDAACWVFVEVKTRRGHGAGYPEDALTDRKLLRLRELAEWYLDSVDVGEVDWRIDLVAIELGPTAADPRINHIRGVDAL